MPVLDAADANGPSSEEEKMKENSNSSVDIYPHVTVSNTKEGQTQMKQSSLEGAATFGTQSNTSLFIFLGLSNDSNIQLVLFYVFFVMYLMTLIGNVGIFIIINFSPSLQTPMYFFLSHLSFIDLCYASSVVPNTMANFLRQVKYISRFGCASQLFLFSSFGSTECLLLGVMAYDRYVAICTPLHYRTIMTKQACKNFIAASYATAVIQAAVQTGYTFSLNFCGSHIIRHFLCDALPLIELSCSNTFLNGIIISCIIYLPDKLVQSAFTLDVFSTNSKLSDCQMKKEENRVKSDNVAFSESFKSIEAHCL
ncbi:olfactory receptor 5AP2-like [Rhinophrynus dorsalis]